MSRDAKQKLASGGHATVWLALDAAGEPVARKCPHPHLVEDGDARFALQREAEIALRLRHPNVVRLRSVDLGGGAPELVFDYVAGANLAELIRDWQATPPASAARAAVRIVLDVAAGLAALHDLRDEKGAPLSLLHRDVSPQNVLVGVDGVARLSDFGLAKCLASDRPTTEGVLKGKAGYLAPEYVRGELGDRRQDIFALGVVSWEALARTRLFRGATDAQTLERILSAPIPSLVDTLGEAAAPLDSVLARALARTVDERFATATAFAEALTDAARQAGLLGTADDVRTSFSEARRKAVDEQLASVRRGVKRRAARRVAVVSGLAAAGLAAAAAGASLRSSPAPPVGSSSAAGIVAAPSTIAAAASTSLAFDAGEAPPLVDVTALESVRLDAGRSRPPAAGGHRPRPNPYGSASGAARGKLAP